MLAQLKVLIVDDEENIRHFCQTVLLQEGLTVELAADGYEALKALAASPYDLIVLDITMPGLDGLAILAEVATHYRQISPIVMTGYATLEAAIQAQDLGAEGFLLKPFDHVKLLNIIHRVIERRLLRQDYARLQTHLPLIALSHRLVTEQNLTSLAQAALEIARLETHALAAALWVLPLAPAGRSSNSLYCLAAIGQPPPPPGPDWPANTNWLALDESGQPAPTLAQAHLLHLLLQTEGHRVGWLSLSQPGTGLALGDRDLDFLMVMSNYLAAGLENRRLYEAIDLVRQEWETIFNTLNDGLLVHLAPADPLDRNCSGPITRINQTLAAWLNTTVEELLGRPASDIVIDAQGLRLCQLIPPGSLPPAGPISRATGQSVEFSSPPWAPGKSFRVRTFPLYAGRGSTAAPQLAEVIHVLEDITETNRAQNHLRQAEKLAALGRLSASLAHEINNPLQTLRSGLRLLGRAKLEDTKRYTYVTRLEQEVERLISLTTQTLDFARPGRAGKEPADLNHLLRAILTLVKQQLQQRRIEVDFRPGKLPTLLIVPGQIKQVFLNLILNAIDAMPNGGRLTLSTGLAADNRVLTRLADTGSGIPPELIGHIFEPFFSTKEAGSGLGLTISYSIVEAHGGAIEVSSQPGEGTCFAVYLPVSLTGSYGAA